MRQMSWRRIGDAVTQRCCFLMFSCCTLSGFFRIKKAYFLTVFKGLVVSVLSLVAAIDLCLFGSKKFMPNMPVNVSKAFAIATKTAKSLLAVSYQEPIDKPKVFACYKAQANGALLAFDEEMTVQSTGWKQAENTHAETLSKQCKLQLILASIDSSILQLWPNDIAECETSDSLLQFLTQKLDDKTPTWEKNEKYMAKLKAIRHRPGERYVDFFFSTA